MAKGPATHQDPEGCFQGSSSLRHRRFHHRALIGAAVVLQSVYSQHHRGDGRGQDLQPPVLVGKPEVGRALKPQMPRPCFGHAGGNELTCYYPLAQCGEARAEAPLPAPRANHSAQWPSFAAHHPPGADASVTASPRARRQRARPPPSLPPPQGAQHTHSIPVCMVI